MSGEVLDTAFVEIKPKFDDAGFAKVGGTVTKAVAPAAKSVDKALSSAFDSAARAADRSSASMSAALGKVDAAAKRTSTSIGSNLSKGAAVATGALAAIGFGSILTQAAAASDATDKFKQSLMFSGVNTKAIDAATKATQAYADQTVYDLATIQNATAQLASNGVKNYSGLVQAAGNLNAVAGGNADTFKSVAMVLTQTAGQGKLTTENFNQLSDAIAGASGPLQKQLEKNGAFTGNFRDAMAKGQITAEEFNKALLQLGNKPVAVEAAKSTKTFEGAIGNLQALIVGKLALALNSMKPLITSVINGITVGFGIAADAIQTAADVLAGTVKFLKNNAVVAGILGAVLAAMTARIIAAKIATMEYTIAQKAIMLATKAWTAVQTALNLVLGNSPIGRIVTLIALLAAGIVVAYKKSETFRDIVNAVFKSVGDTVKAVIDAIVAAWNAMTSALMIAWSTVTAALSAIATALGAAFSAVWTGIQVAFQTVFAVMSAVFQTWWAGVQVILNVIVGAFSLVWNTVKATFQTVVSAMVTIWNAFRDVVAAALRVLQAIFNAVWNGIKAVFIAIVNVMSAAWNGFANGVMAIAHVVGSVANGIWNGMKSAFSAVVNSMTSVWNGFIGGVKTALSGIGGAFSSAFGAVTGVVKGTLNGVIGVLNTAIRFINDKLIDTANKVPFVNIPHIGEIPLLQEDGGIHTRPTHTISGENGPEAIVPLGSHKRRQREKVLAAAGLLGGYNGSTAFDRSGGRSSGGSVSAGGAYASSTAKVVNNEFHQTFNLLPGGDPYTHAHQIAARVAAGAGR